MIRITSPVTGTYIYTPNTILGSTDDGMGLDHIADWGSIRIRTVTLSDILIFDIALITKESFPVTIEVDCLLLILNFTLEGTTNSSADGYLSFEEGKHQSLFSVGYSKATININESLKLVSICFLEQSLKRIASGLTEQLSDITENAKQQLALFQSARIITPQMSDVIQAMLTFMHKKGNHPIYFEAKALELLFLELEQIEGLSERSSNSFLKEHDLERIHQAKIIVQENLLNPCSLLELAHKVGLNDFKLKKGFREVLGTTVFGYLFDLRMEKAKSLLKSGLPVREVAYEVGYKNAHHFTNAFKKKFGYLPSKISRFLAFLYFCSWVY